MVGHAPNGHRMRAAALSLELAMIYGNEIGG